MPLFDYLKLDGDHVRRALDPGEELYAVERCALALGDDDELQLPYAYQGFGERFLTRAIGPKLEVRERQNRHWISGWGSYGIIWSPRITSAVNRFFIAPRRAAGGPGSTAAEFVVGMHRSRAQTYCAVTDRRLVLLDKSWPPAEEDEPRCAFAMAATIDREQFASIGWAPRFLLLPQWGRVLFTFADGSEVAVMAGIFAVQAARRLVGALAS